MVLAMSLTLASFASALVFGLVVYLDSFYGNFRPGHPLGSLNSYVRDTNFIRTTIVPGLLALLLGIAVAPASQYLWPLGDRDVPEGEQLSVFFMVILSMLAYGFILWFVYKSLEPFSSIETSPNDLLMACVTLDLSESEYKIERARIREAAVNMNGSAAYIAVGRKPGRLPILGCVYKILDSYWGRTKGFAGNRYTHHDVINMRYGYSKHREMFPESKTSFLEIFIFALCCPFSFLFFWLSSGSALFAIVVCLLRMTGGALFCSAGFILINLIIILALLMWPGRTYVSFCKKYYCHIKLTSNYALHVSKEGVWGCFFRLISDNILVYNLREWF